MVPGDAVRLELLPLHRRENAADDEEEQADAAQDDVDEYRRRGRRVHEVVGVPRLLAELWPRVLLGGVRRGAPLHLIGGEVGQRHLLEPLPERVALLEVEADSPLRRRGVRVAGPLVLGVAELARPVLDDARLRRLAKRAVADGPLARPAAEGVPELVPLLLAPPVGRLHAVRAVEPEVLDAVVPDVLDDRGVHQEAAALRRPDLVPVAVEEGPHGFSRGPCGC